MVADLGNDELFHVALDGFIEFVKLCSDFDRFRSFFQQLQNNVDVLN